MPEEHRHKIKVSNILARLTKLATGEIGPDEMAPHAVTAALGVLRKALPDLSAQDVTVTDATPFAVIPDQMTDAQAWSDRFAPKPDTEH